MHKLTQILDFIRYVLSAWHKAFSTKPKAGEGSQTSVEEMDAEAWERAKKDYEDSMLEKDTEFWRGEGGEDER